MAGSLSGHHRDTNNNNNTTTVNNNNNYSSTSTTKNSTKDDEIIHNPHQQQQSPNTQTFLSSHNGLLLDACPTPITPKKPFHFQTEATLLLSIALPTVVSQFCGYFIFPLTAASFSRYLPSSSSSSSSLSTNIINTSSREALAAFSLASLSGNASCTSTVIGILTASETLQPRAFGLRNYHQVGILAIRSLLVCTVFLILPIVLLCTNLDYLLEVVGGQNAEASQMAGAWIKLYVIGIPSVILFRILQRFLACQGLVQPCMLGSAIGCLLVHPISHLIKMVSTKMGV